MNLEVIAETNEVLVRRLSLNPGESMFWHIDSCRRFTVVLRGSELTIEYKESKSNVKVDIFAGMSDWADPDSQVHRATNTGSVAYEKIVTFFKNDPAEDPQPKIEV